MIECSLLHLIKYWVDFHSIIYTKMHQNLVEVRLAIITAYQMNLPSMSRVSEPSPYIDIKPTALNIVSIHWKNIILSE